MEKTDGGCMKSIMFVIINILLIGIYKLCPASNMCSTDIKNTEHKNEDSETQRI